MKTKKFQIILNDSEKDAVEASISERDRICTDERCIHPEFIPYNTTPRQWHLVLSPEELRALLCDLWLFGTGHAWNHGTLYEFARQLTFQ